MSETQEPVVLSFIARFDGVEGLLQLHFHHQAEAEGWVRQHLRCDFDYTIATLDNRVLATGGKATLQ